MKTAVFALIAATMAAPAAAFDSWSKRDVALETTYQVLHWADAATTADIHNHDDVQEVGPAGIFLGNNPEPMETFAFFAVTSAAHAAVTHVLPRKYRPYWQGVTIVVEGGYVANNVSLGLRWGFK